MKAWEDRTKKEIEVLFNQVNEHLMEFSAVMGATGISDFMKRLVEWNEKRRAMKLRCPSGYYLTSHSREDTGCECDVK